MLGSKGNSQRNTPSHWVSNPRLTLPANFFWVYFAALEPTHDR